VRLALPTGKRRSLVRDRQFKSRHCERSRYVCRIICAAT
jgi:hypothetical protein